MIAARPPVLLLLAILPAFAFAQVPDYTMEWGEFQRINHLPKSVQIAGAGSDAIHVVKSDRKGQLAIDVPWIIEQYNKETFQRTDSVLLKIKEGGQIGQVEKVLTIDKEIYVFYSLRGRHHVTLYAKRLDQSTFKLEDKSKRLIEITRPKGQPLRKGNFEFASSPDGSKIFVVRHFSRDSLHRQLTAFAMLDNRLNLLWQKKVTLPYPEGQLKFRTVKMNDVGQALMLTAYKFPNQWNATFALLIVGNMGQSVWRYTLQAEEGFLSGLQIEVDGTKNLLCAGFYSKTGGMGARGSYFARISLDHPAIPRSKVSEFDTRFILQDQHKMDVTATLARAEMGGEAELDSYEVDRILKEKDGSMLVIGEQRYEYSTSPSRSYRGDIVVVKLDSSGQKLWGKRIHKSQDTRNANKMFASYMLMSLRGRLVILFNDDQRNVTPYRTLNTKDFAGTKSILVMASVDAHGEVMREWLFQSTNSDVAVIPAMCSQLSERELILYGRHGNRQQFSRINFK